MRLLLFFSKDSSSSDSTSVLNSTAHDFPEQVALQSMPEMSNMVGGLDILQIYMYISKITLLTAIVRSVHIT